MFRTELPVTLPPHITTNPLSQVTTIYYYKVIPHCAVSAKISLYSPKID
jgi:hypothetical protein